MHLLTSVPHKRWNPLEREWVLVSPHRTQRPWQGQVESVAVPAGIAYDPVCYLCPGNERAGGHRNPAYESTFVFTNDYAALKPGVEAESLNLENLIRAQSERGICKVVCFSPVHHLTLPRMAAEDVRDVIDVWGEQYEQIAANDWIRYIQVFENRGEMMGASNPHPHGQIWASESLPNRIEQELESQTEYWHGNHKCLLCEYLKLELSSRERIVAENDLFVAVIPFWAIWPFETMVLPKFHAADLNQFDGSQRTSFGDILQQVTTRYDNLFQVSFPYSMGLHGAPLGIASDGWHFHVHFLPPLLRSATVRKFMVGYELMGSPQRDITPESAAERLRNLPGRHYSAPQAL